MDVDNDDEVMEAPVVPETTDEVTDLTNPDVVTKYKTASDIANKTLQGVISFCKPDANVADICTIGDTLITKQCDAVFKSKKMDKGIAFPTCLSINHCVCHFSPLTSESVKLVAGDIVKIDLGVQIDGYIAVVAHTIIIPGAPINPAAVDVIHAAYVAAEAAVRLVKPGNQNGQVTDMLKDVATSYGVQNVQGVLMHQMKRFVIDGNQVIIGREEVDQKVDTVVFEDAQVYTIDVVMSTGEGKPIQREARTTVFKRAVDQTHQLKLKASRYVLNEINKKHATLPFTIRAMDEKQARLGVTECVKNNMVVSYPVLFEKPGDIVAHFKFTVLLLPTGTAKITGLPVDLSQIPTTKSPSEAVKLLLSTSSQKKKKKKSKKTTGAATTTAASSGAMDVEGGGDDDDEE